MLRPYLFSIMIIEAILRKLLFSFCFLLIITFTASSASRLPEYGRRGMVVSASEIASEIGLQVLADGGNAVDAAVAAAFALGVVEQYSSGLGGGNFIVIYLAEYDSAIAIDGREAAPLKAKRDMFLDKSTGLPIPESSTVGVLAGGVPGAAASLCLALEKYGTIPLNRILEPSIEIAEKGFILNQTYIRSLEYNKEKLALFPDSKAIYFKDDSTLWQLGDTLVQKDLADTYRHLAANGPGAFYKGEIARRIVEFEKAHGGLITMKDLENYQAKFRTPIRGNYRGYDIISMPPPSSGGVHLMQMLNILENYDLPQYGHNSSDYIHILAEAMKPAFADRAQFLGDPDFNDIPIAGLISKEYAASLRAKIEVFQTADVSPGEPIQFVPAEGHTTHLSAADQWGNLAAVTATVNTGFGSGMTITGTGIILNNEMDDFSTAPGQPNFFGLIGNEANSVQPGKRPLSSMTPTIVLKDKKGVMAAGSPGGPRIITAVLQAVINTLDFEMNIQQAVDMPRVHHQWKPDILFVDPDISFDVLRNLTAKGHRIYRGGVGSSVEAVYIDQETGLFYGGADSRNEGCARGLK